MDYSKAKGCADMLFNIACTNFLDYIEVTKSTGTFRLQVSKVSLLKKYFNNCELDSISNFEIIAFIRFSRVRNPKISEVTLNMYVSTLKRVIKYNSKRVVEFEKLPEIRKIVPVVNEDTINKVFNYLRKQFNHKEGLRNYVLFKLLLDTGLRINEELNLRIRDIDFSSNTIHVKITKTKSERYVFFTEGTKKVLKRLITTHKIKDHIFMNYKGNKMLSVDNVQNICFRIEKRLELEEKIRPHKWRHTFATNFLKRGGDLESLRLILGHTSLKTTQKYLHLDKDFLHDEYFKTHN